MPCESRVNPDAFSTALLSSNSASLKLKREKVSWLRGAWEGVRNVVCAVACVSLRRTMMCISRVSLLILALLSAVTTMAQEKKIHRADLPAAVEKAVVAQSQGATIRGFSEETENGNTYYEAQMSMNGHGKDVLMDKTGTVVAVEE